ncbi:MAG: hypothetical protein LUC87_01505 [Clostridiales bacterium]|nr:hypothetical protein [Clostridiales bacterium]
MEQEEQERQLLEQMLTQSCGKRTEAGPVAERLLAEFGSLYDVLHASSCALEQVEGVSRQFIRFTRLTAALFERCHQEEQDERNRLRTPWEAMEYLRPYFFSVQREQLYLLLLDGRNRVKVCHHLAEGELDSVHMDFGAIVKLALECGASRVILAHCHISTSELPSEADLTITVQMKQVLDDLGIKLMDHIIFADGAESSMAELGLLGWTAEQLYGPDSCTGSADQPEQ